MLVNTKTLSSPESAIGRSPPSSINGGERHGKGRPAAEYALDRERAAMRCHNLLHNIEAKPAPPRLRGIQGLENLRELLGRDATPGIPDLELDVCGRTLARQCERAALRHGI